MRSGGVCWRPCEMRPWCCWGIRTFDCCIQYAYIPKAKGLQWVSDRYGLHTVWEGSISLRIDLQTVAVVNDEGFLFCILSRQRPFLQGVQQIPHDLMTWKWLEAAEFRQKNGFENVCLALVLVQSFVWSDVIQYVSTFAIVGQLL